MVMSYILFSAMGFGVMEGLACGSALASTGIGFTLTLMKDLDLLATPLGQLVAAAAMIHDVSSMVLLAILQGATSMAETGDADALAMIKPVIASLGLFAASIIIRMIAVKAIASGEEQDAKAELEATHLYLHEKILGIVTAGICFAVIADKIGSTHLLGCFLAGVVATSWKSFQEIWEPMVEPILPWMTMAFFSCTVGFAVPVQALAAKDWGLVIAIVLLAILSKIATGAFVGSPMEKGYGLQALQVGAAMVGRGELGFMQISTAYKLGMVSLGVYGGTVWGLLVASVLGPFMFRGAVNFAKGQEGKQASAEPEGAGPVTTAV
jgi:Kef-type K+ transport system membrane component KefB